MKTNKSSWRFFHLLGLTCLLAGLDLAAWGTTDADLTSTNSNGWDVRLGVPIWVAGVKGTVGVLGREGHIDKSFSDIADVLDFTIALNLEVRKNRWVFLTDSLYLKTSTSGQPEGSLAGVVSSV